MTKRTYSRRGGVKDVHSVVKPFGSRTAFTVGSERVEVWCGNYSTKAEARAAHEAVKKAVKCLRQGGHLLMSERVRKSVL